MIHWVSLIQGTEKPFFSLMLRSPPPTQKYVKKKEKIDVGSFIGEGKRDVRVKNPRTDNNLCQWNPRPRRNRKIKN